MYTLSLNWSN